MNGLMRRLKREGLIAVLLTNEPDRLFRQGIRDLAVSLLALTIDVQLGVE